jgi:hypothetical protein
MTMPGPHERALPLAPAVLALLLAALLMPDGVALAAIGQALQHGLADLHRAWDWPVGGGLRLPMSWRAVLTLLREALAALRVQRAAGYSHSGPPVQEDRRRRAAGLGRMAVAGISTAAGWLKAPWPRHSLPSAGTSEHQPGCVQTSVCSEISSASSTSIPR